MRSASEPTGAASVVAGGAEGGDEAVVDVVFGDVEWDVLTDGRGARDVLAG
jgi:hypothetical protein